MAILIKDNIPLAPYTLYKIGGNASFFVEVSNEEDLREALELSASKGVNFFILGAGSNILVNDKGFYGLVIKINMREIHLAEGGKLAAEGGVSMAQAVLASAKAGLTGFEWAIGVPGTIGGSVRGNAGCFGYEIKDVVESVHVLDFRKSDFLELTNSECQFGYRDSIFKRNPEWVILSAVLKLQQGEPEKIQENIKRITAERAAKQDIGTKSCGCIFKNISWSRKGVDRNILLRLFPELLIFKNSSYIPASFLIDQAGLKGKRVGRVFISPKHANYFVNDGGATAEEVVMLISIVKDTVKRKFGLLLGEEIQYVGF